MAMDALRWGWLAAPLLCIPAQGLAEQCLPAQLGGDGDIDALVETERQAQHIEGMAVGVVWGDELYLAGYGQATRRRPVSPTGTYFRWASVSKTVTATAALIAQQEGLLAVEDEVGDLYPAYALPGDVLLEGWGGEPGIATEPLPEGSVLTLAMLLGHLGGIQHYSNGLANPTPPVWERDDPSVNTGFTWALSRFTGAPLIAVPGDRYSYTTMGFNLAGAAVGQAWADGSRDELSADEAFVSLVETRIAHPAGADGLTPDYHWERQLGRADGFVILSADRTIPDTDTDVSWKLPGGGFMSTIGDMACYCRFLAEGEGLSDESRSLLWTSQLNAGGGATGYGMGFSVGSRGGRPRVSHNGEQEKATSRLVLYPDDGLCVVILTNTRSATSDVSINLSRVANGVEDVVRARAAAGEPLFASP